MPAYAVHCGIVWFGLLGCGCVCLCGIADNWTGDGVDVDDGLGGELELELAGGFSVGFFFGPVSVKTHEPNVGEDPHPQWGGSPSIHPSFPS